VWQFLSMQVHRVQPISSFVRDDITRFNLIAQMHKHGSDHHSGYTDDESSQANAPPPKPEVSVADDVDFYA